MNIKFQKSRLIKVMAEVKFWLTCISFFLGVHMLEQMDWAGGL